MNDRNETCNNARSVTPESRYSYNRKWADAVAPFEHGSAESFRLQEGNGVCSLQYVKRDIAEVIPSLRPGKWFDIITPFDYGGFNASDDAILEKFLNVFETRCRDEKIVSAFFRFNPMLRQNYDVLRRHMDVVKVQDHVVIMLKEDFRRGYSRRKLRTIKKAQRYDAEFIAGDSMENFHAVYTDSMRRIGANGYFFFDKASLDALLPFGKIFSIRFEGRTVSSLFIIEEGETLYYFLGGTLADYLPHGFNALLFDAVCEYYKATKTSFSLGGGKGGLYRYKEEFSPHRVPFYIGKKVFDTAAYAELCRLSGREEKNFFPQYREKII